MKNILKNIIFALCTLPVFNAHAFFFKVEKHDKMQQWSNDTQSRYLVSDYHYCKRPENKCSAAQQQALLDHIKNVKGAVIVEDGVILDEKQLYTTTSAHEQTYLELEQLQSQNVKTPLHNFTSWCFHESIPCTNVEFRYSTERPLSVYCTLLENKKQQILSYKDGAVLEKYYAEKIAHLENLIEKPCKQIFDLFKKSDKTLPEFLQSTRLPQIENVDEILNNFQYDGQWNTQVLDYNTKIRRIFNKYCCALLDLEILHALAQYRDQKNVFILAGDFHIDCIKDALEKLGFSKTASVGTDIEIDHNGIDCLEPTAIDIQQIDGLTTVEQPATSFFSTVINALYTFIAQLLQLP